MEIILDRTMQPGVIWVYEFWENLNLLCYYWLSLFDGKQPNIESVTFPSSDPAQKMKFSIKDFFSKCDQIRRKLRIWSHLLKKSLIENFIFSAVRMLHFYICLYIFPLWVNTVVKRSSPNFASSIKWIEANIYAAFIREKRS